MPGLPMDMLKLIFFCRILRDSVLTAQLQGARSNAKPNSVQKKKEGKKTIVWNLGPRARKRKGLHLERPGEKKKVEKDLAILLCYIVLHDAQCTM